MSSHALADVTVGGSRWRVAMRGDGPPVLLVNGVGANLSIWGPLARRLDGHQVISFDAPGIGASEAPRSPMRLRKLAERTADLIAELGHEQVDVVGHSMGGMIALELAHRAPSTVGRLVLCNTAPGMPAIPPLNPLAWAAVVTPVRSTRLVTAAAGGRTAREPGMAEKMAGSAADRPTWRSLATQMYAVPGWSSWPWLHQVEHETLILAGTSDPVIPPLNSRLLAWRMPNAQLQAVDGGGHLMTVDQPEVVGDLIADFLA